MRSQLANSISYQMRLQVSEAQRKAAKAVAEIKAEAWNEMKRVDNSLQFIRGLGLRWWKYGKNGVTLYHRATPAFWDAWRRDKSLVKNHCLEVRKVRGKWYITLFDSAIAYYLMAK